MLLPRGKGGLLTCAVAVAAAAWAWNVDICACDEECSASEIQVWKRLLRAMVTTVGALVLLALPFLAAWLVRAASTTERQHQPQLQPQPDLAGLAENVRRSPSKTRQRPRKGHRSDNPPQLADADDMSALRLRVGVLQRELEAAQRYAVRQSFEEAARNAQAAQVTDVLNDRFRKWVDELRQPDAAAISSFSPVLQLMMKYRPMTVPEVLEHRQQPIVLTTAEWPFRVVWANAAWTALCGWHLHEVLGAHCKFLQGDSTDVVKTDELCRSACQTGYGQAEVINYKKDGTPFTNRLTLIPVVSQPHGREGVAVQHVGIMAILQALELSAEQQRVHYDPLAGRRSSVVVHDYDDDLEPRSPPDAWRAQGGGSSTGAGRKRARGPGGSASADALSPAISALPDTAGQLDGWRVGPGSVRGGGGGCGSDSSNSTSIPCSPDAQLVDAMHDAAARIAAIEQGVAARVDGLPATPQASPERGGRQRRPRCFEELTRDPFQDTPLAATLAFMARSSEALILTNKLGRICSVNRAWVDLCGYTASEVEGKTCSLLQGPETDRNQIAALNEKIRALETAEIRIRNYKRGGEPFINHLKVHPILTRDRDDPSQTLCCHFLARLREAVVEDNMPPF